MMNKARELLNELKEEWHVIYTMSDEDKSRVEKGFTSKKQAEKWVKGENLRNRAEDIEVVKA